ncbi:molecular chaperone HtpG [Flexibacter flexilis DSM 6793]|uniref:Chaperone protein HtpG n=1 Tax=Flexibacter flexilis DSM 6793 TaxID=927664 RepID=A0A1I1GT86_9BACT|nr:molecular chaperone HtpG [Flexibacter flexilis]SFC12250.1 molecular chaperone HtpG [Flexibacter flexilis DSM 6793]
MVAEEKGTISIHTENIFPIIKKFLYSDHDIFLRELVSNAVDASQKLKRLAAIGEFTGEMGELLVKVSFDKEQKTITISDNGIGMTADEIKKYINQIAFSGASEFLEKYKDKASDGQQQIIGHFGLGFYSAFMVASTVEIITKSYREGSQAARWTCDGSTQYEITEAERQERGTDIILHIAEDSEEFLDKWRLSGILTKYCKFLPVQVELEGEKINNTQPLWTKSPSELKDEDYIAFYKELYPTAADPLFWIHLNVDYPFNLTGVLYFPKVDNNFEVNRDKIQLYSRQVFITDEVKDVVPEFLMLLHGVIDSPDIPLNVSRSFLQADSNVKKINAHITKKVADKLAEIFNNDRKGFEEKWDSINVFVKYGIISDDKFFERAKPFALLKNTESKLFTLDEYKEHTKANQTDKTEQLVWLYSNDAQKQSSYIQAATKRSFDVLLFDHIIDSHYIAFLERHLEKTAFKRVDADLADKLIDKDVSIASVLSDTEKETVKEIFNKNIGGEGVALSVESLSPDDLPVTITLPEFMRRMKEMYATNSMGNMFGAMPDSKNVTVNANHPLIGKILAESNEATKTKLIRHAYDLALLSQNELKGQALAEFIERSVSLLN